MAVAPDGRVVATENADQSVAAIEISSGKQRAQLGKANPVAGQPNPDAALVLNGGVVLRGAPSASNGGTCVTFSPDGSLLACKGPNQSIRIWDVVAAKEIGQFKGHRAAITALAFTPDGNRLVSAS